MGGIQGVTGGVRDTVVCGSLEPGLAAPVNNRAKIRCIHWQKKCRIKWEELSLPTLDAPDSYPKYPYMATTHLFLHPFHGNSGHSTGGIMCTRLSRTHAHHQCSLIRPISVLV